MKIDWTDSTSYQTVCAKTFPPFLQEQNWINMASCSTSSYTDFSERYHFSDVEFVIRSGEKKFSPDLMKKWQNGLAT